MPNTELYFDPQQLDGLIQAIRRAPGNVLVEVKNFLVRGVREYNTFIIRNPWRVGGGGGGGAPVATGNLRDTHVKEINPWDAKIYPTAKYAKYVHDGTRKMPGRPWLEFAKHAAEGQIDALQTKLLNNILYDLAK